MRHTPEVDLLTSHHSRAYTERHDGVHTFEVTPMHNSPTPMLDAAASRATVGAEIFGGANALSVSYWTEGLGVAQVGTVPR